MCCRENTIQFKPFQKLLNREVTTTCIRMARDFSIRYVQSAALVFPALVGCYEVLPTLGCSQNTLPHYTEQHFHPAPPLPTMPPSPVRHAGTKHSSSGSSVTHSAQPTPPRISRLLLGLCQSKATKKLEIWGGKIKTKKSPQHFCTSFST